MPDRPLNGSREQQLRSALNAAGQRVTGQRLAILEALGEFEHHVSAEEVRAAAAKRSPRVSLPTVYATLELFDRLGLLRRVSAGDRLLYDPRPEEHQHFVCRRCGLVEDLDVEVDAGEALSAAKRIGHRAEGAGVVVTGLCSACAASAAGS
jgi:Fe2+ or Zn2+ uptake regulation protein